jgi:hypothetical protein
LVWIEVDETTATMSQKEFIVKYLLEVKEAYVHQMYAAWADFASKIGKKPGDYKNTRRVVSDLKKEGVITFSREEPMPYPKFSRIYYKLVV